MSSTKIAALLVAGLIGAPDSFAQTTSSQVTFEVPLNLTRLSPLITQVAVTCTVPWGPNPPSRRVEAPVTNGQVVGTIPVVLDLASMDLKPGTTTVRYECTLLGFSSASGGPSGIGGWWPFDGKSGAAFTVSPLPQPILGSFTW